MAADCSVSVLTEVTGLGKELNLAEKFSVTTTPARAVYHYMIQATTNTAEALPVGDIGTVQLVILKCVENDVDIDTSYSASFSAEIEVQEGEVAIFKPTGTVYFQNDDTDELSTIEYIAVGSA